MDGRVIDAPAHASKKDGGSAFSINDVDMRPRSLQSLLLEQAPNDGVPRPPYDPLSTGQKLAGVIDAGGSIAGGYFAMNRFRNDGLHVIRADIQSLDKLVSPGDLNEFRSLGSSLRSKTINLYAEAQDNVVAMQTAKPHLFDDMSSSGTTFKGLNIKTPKYGLMSDAEKAVVDRAGNLSYISESLRRGVNTTNTSNFKSGLRNIVDLHNNPVAIAEGLSPELAKLESLGAEVSDQAARSTISMASESRSLLLKNAAVVGAGLATNFIIEKTLLSNSAPNRLTIASDIASPFIVLTDLPLWAKFSVIVGAHALTRLSEYGMAKAGE
jgi:hypothetical protein